MSKFPKSGNLKARLRKALVWRPKAKWPIVLACLGGSVATGVLLRFDLATTDFIGDTKGLTLIHAALPDGPATYIATDGTTFDAQSYKDAHDRDTAPVNVARSHLFYVLLWMLAAPTAVLACFLRAPPRKSVARKSRPR